MSLTGVYHHHQGDDGVVAERQVRLFFPQCLISYRVFLNNGFIFDREVQGMQIYLIANEKIIVLFFSTPMIPRFILMSMCVVSREDTKS
mgnify:CR=1 FL=1